MSDITFPELQALRIEMSSGVQDAQFEAIVAALRDVPADGPAAVPRWKATWRRWAVSVAALGTALVPVAAVASDSAVPGDLLYPVKLTVERIQLIFDRDIDAEHRVNELENLIDRAADVSVIDRHIDHTSDVLERTTDRTDLVERYDDAVSDHVRETDFVPDPNTDEAAPDDGTTDRVPDTATTAPHRESDHHPTDESTVTTVVHDEPEPVTTTTAHRSDESTTTTTASRDGAGDEGDGVDGADGVDGDTASGDQP